ncbi:MAG TPA: hypothetical protein VMG82_26645, partial [Candidatus Sulfotelmatobacter sp.]|nr:hypothetical protein [Candidatus Sulfotelmatobacter sp.]
EQAEIQKALQLELPVVVGKPIPFLYVQMDGTGVPVVKKETVGRQGKTRSRFPTFAARPWRVSAPPLAGKMPGISK